MAPSENYRTETIGRSDCRPIVQLSADTIVRWDYRPNPNDQFTFTLYAPLIANPVTDYNPCNTLTQISECVSKLMKQIHKKINQRKQVVMPCADTSVLVLTVTECTKY